jgi:hypothetical protein
MHGSRVEAHVVAKGDGVQPVAWAEPWSNYGSFWVPDDLREPQLMRLIRVSVQLVSRESRDRPIDPLCPKGLANLGPSISRSGTAVRHSCNGRSDAT